MQKNGNWSSLQARNRMRWTAWIRLCESDRVVWQRS